MKKLNLIINVVLIAAIGILYFLHFKSDSPKEQSKDANSASEISLSKSELPIAYVQIDSLLNQMTMYADLTDNLTTKQQKLETSFGSQYQSFEKEVLDFQNKANKGLLTRKEAQDIETQLGNKRNELENQRNSYMNELQEEGRVSQNKVINYIMEYLKEYNADNKYPYVLSYSFGGGILYANKGLDITSEVLAGINTKYESEKSSK